MVPCWIATYYLLHNLGVAQHTDFHKLLLMMSLFLTSLSITCFELARAAFFSCCTLFVACPQFQPQWHSILFIKWASLSKVGFPSFPCWLEEVSLPHFISKYKLTFIVTKKNLKRREKSA
jgi:hypothetical protein